MSTVTLRFYGRYFYAEGMSGNELKKISAIAPSFDEDRFGKHQPYMSVQRDLVDFGDAGERTTLGPSFRIATDVEKIDNAELFVWDLTGRRVVYDLSGDVSLEVDMGGPRRLLDLSELESIRDADGDEPKLDDDALEVDSGGPSNAIIELTKGKGKARSVVPGGKIRLAKAEDAADTRNPLEDPDDDRLIKDGSGEFIEFEPADLVEFEIDLGDKKSLKLRFIDSSNNEVGFVTVKEKTCVAFSHLCAGVRAPTKPDLEFSQYYELLEDAPGDDALVPFELPLLAAGLIEGSDCDMQARLKYKLE